MDSMTEKSKGAPVSRHPNADRVIPNPHPICKKPLSILQMFVQSKGF